MAAEVTPLSLKQKLGYGVGDLGQTVFYQAVLLYLIYFYTDVAGIAPTAVASILLVARLIDAAANPLIGAAADRTQTRWGRFRPFVLFAPVPLALMAIATFSTISGSPLAKQIYATLSYAAFSICFASVAIPYSALLATITSNSRERSELGTLRAGFSLFAGVIVSLVMLPLVAFAGGGLGGFHVAITVLGVLGVSLLWITFATTKEQRRIDHQPAPKLGLALRSLARKPLILFVLIFLMSNMSGALRSAGVIYYFKYTLLRPELVSVFLTFSAVVTIIGIAITPLAVRLTSKRTIMIVGLALMAMGYVGVSFGPASVAWIFVWIGFVGNVGYGMKVATTWPILADCVDHVEWSSRRRIEGLAYGFVTFSQKFALALGGSVAGLTLGATGYVADKIQTPLAQEGILALVGYFPAACLLAAVVFAILYPLTAKRVEAMNQDLSVRREQPTVQC